ncbi:hypothetical protein DFH09DRAFT_1330013 [Mycena vulgaris]|nr:hypothetical protein DFH09DRAFT_1330013 [Mycena vulgaris]
MHTAFIATSALSGDVPAITPAPTAWDLHVYSTATFFHDGILTFSSGIAYNSSRFGEYAAMTSDTGVRLSFPTIDGAVAEASYMTGFDRKSDIVFASAYPPLLKSSSFKGDMYLNSTTNIAASPVQWSVTKDTAINTAETNNTVVFTLPFTILSTEGTGTVLTARSGTQNIPGTPNTAVPQSFTFTAGETITYEAPGLSASVLIVSAQ